MYQKRYRRIVNFFAIHILSLIIWDVIFPHIGLRKWSRDTRPERLGKLARSYRDLAIEMGGVLIKVGQFLSSRVDILPPEFTNELVGLQDEVPPASFEDIKDVTENEFGMPLNKIFVAFDPNPLAAASLGQVHRAKIFKPQPQSSDTNDFPPQNNVKADTEIINVVVKVQRPDIENIIATDLSALQTVTNWLQKYPPINRRANVPALMAEFTRTLYEEIDYINEAHNAEVFADNFKSEPMVRVPQIIHTYSTKRVLTLENVWGIKITDYDKITASGVSRSDVASHLIDTYLKQIFDDGFFHADPHPGNLFVNPIPILPPISFGRSSSHQNSSVFWQLTFVDFGMVGHVSESMKEGLRELLIGIGTKDVSRVIMAYQMLDILLPGADIRELEKAGDDIFDLFWGKNMAELSEINTQEVYKLTKEYRHLIYSLPIQFPQNLLFLGRAMGILSGLCTGLDPEFNLFDHLIPYAQKLVIEETKIDPKSLAGEISVLARSLFSLPGKIDDTLYKLERGDIAVKMPEVSKNITNLEGAVRQVTWGIVFASLLLGGIQLRIADENNLALILFIGAIISLLGLIFSGRKK
jgi:predicted unusual protein kinase regulating ubiquinone biosynthesis (AarF/ABC1/UbiB family)